MNLIKNVWKRDDLDFSSSVHKPEAHGWMEEDFTFYKAIRVQI